MLNINVVGQQQGSLIAAAVAEVSRVERPRGGGRSVSAAAAVTQSALQGEYMRKVLAGRAEGLDTFKLQFNCCGTGVEKVRARAMGRLPACASHALCASRWIVS